MKPAFFTLFFLASLFASSALFGQEDLTRDAAFFQNQKTLYQRWLDQTGLGRTLRVQEIEVKPDEVAVFLAFPFENADSCLAAWTQLKKDFSNKNPGQRLEQQLFFKAAHMLELRRSKVNVQLFDTYNLKKEPCFYRGIHSDGAGILVDSTGCKSEKVNLHISPSDLKNTKVSKAEIARRMSQEAVFERIFQIAKQRYEQRKPGCEGRTPTVGEPFSDENVLKFEVTDLCKEVLADETNATVCDWLRRFGKPCNWIKREKLALTFTFLKRGEGFELRCEIEGKVGSGYYDQVQRGGYIDMEVDFDQYLKAYAEGFQREVKRVLTQ